MQMVLLIGIPATGKSTFYRELFYRTHVRINLDMLGTRRREDLLVRACIEGKTKFVVDNTNVSRMERGRYLAAAKPAGFSITGYFFESRVADALARNQKRPAEDRIPDQGVLAGSGRLELPSLAEGFDQLFFVRLIGSNEFRVEDWRE